MTGIVALVTTMPETEAYRHKKEVYTRKRSQWLIFITELPIKVEVI